MADETWVQVATVSRDDEANLIEGFLRSEGIEARLDDRKFHMEPVNFGDLAILRILVRTEDSSRAKELLARRGREFQKLERSGDEESILTESGPADAPPDDQ